MTMAAWERLPAEHRPALLASVQEVAHGLRAEVRRAEEEAIVEMVDRGLTVVRLDATNLAAWESKSMEIYPELQCARDYPDLFERVLSIQGESLRSR